MKPGKLIKRLYKQIPSFECIPGCTSCCAFVYFSQWEWKRIPEHKRKSTTYAECPYIDEGGCSIYTLRPLVCRMFGAVNDTRMLCPYGRGPLVILTAGEGQSIMKEYLAVIYHSAKTPYVDDQGNMISMDIVLKSAGDFRELVRAARNVAGPL